MTSASLRSGTASVPVWRLIVVSFFPAANRTKADQYVRHLPLLLILLGQAIAGIRLSNSAFQDEALYAYMGKWILGSWIGSEGRVYTEPEKFFSGAPQLYPIVSGLLDTIGGLGLTRLFSTLCMLSVTVAIYWMTNVMFAHRPGVRPGILAAVVLAASASVLFLTHLATYDAMSFAMIAWALAIGTWSSKRRLSLWWSVLVGVLCAVAVLLKYASAIDVPFVVAISLVAAASVRRNRYAAFGRSALSGVVCLAILVGSVVTWAAPLLAGIRSTTTDRTALITPAGVGHMLSLVMTWAGVPFALVVIGGLYLARRQPVLATVLVAGAVAAPVYQIMMGETVSFNKHLVLGLVLGAPLIGVLLSGVLRMRYAMAPVLAVVWIALVLGLIQSRTMFQMWPDTTPLSRVLQYSIDSMPWIRMVGDTPEPLQYSLDAKTQPWQWTGTYNNSFYYKGLSGVPAYERALKDNYFQLAFLDGSYPISRALIPRMSSFGFRETGEVRWPPTNSSWRIYQRFDGLRH